MADKKKSEISDSKIEQLPREKLTRCSVALPNTYKFYKETLEDATTKCRPQGIQVISKTSFLDSLLQTVASLLVNKTGMERRLEFHLATRVRSTVLDGFLAFQYSVV
jgi:hypothetical protein